MFLLLLLDNSFLYNPSLSRLLSIFRETSVVNIHQSICYPVSLTPASVRQIVLPPQI
jgi:hypothetical protein